MKTKIALALVVLAIPVYAVIAFIGSEGALMERFPNIPKQDVIRAHRLMIRRTLKGRYADLDTENDDVLDKLFLEIIEELKK